MHGTKPLESQLHGHLAEHLNSEICLRSIIDLKMAVKWIKSSFYYVRALKNPVHYGLDPNVSKATLEQKLERI